MAAKPGWKCKLCRQMQTRHEEPTLRVFRCKDGRTATFERFVTNHLNERRPAGTIVSGQKSLYLDRAGEITIRPDILVREGARTVLVADCKYKHVTPGEFGSHDVYQVLAYCTATNCTDGLLLYPTSELGVARQTASIVNSAVKISQLTVDLGVPRELGA